MAGNFLDSDDEITGINVTPLVDVMLVLLIIFMVTSSYIVHRSIDIKLPAASSSDTAVSKHLALSLSKTGVLHLDGEEISFEEIPVYIRKISATSKDPVQVLISADENTPHGQVVKLIDTVRKNGITDFAINVEDLEASPSQEHKERGTKPSVID